LFDSHLQAILPVLEELQSVLPARRQTIERILRDVEYLAGREINVPAYPSYSSRTSCSSNCRS
jgi:hypothetical protein